MNRLAIYAGTFDPITLGHLDVVRRAAHVFERLIVAVSASSRKPEAMFSIEERLDMVRDSVAELGNTEVEPFDGLLVDHAHARGARVLVRGLRAFSDFEFEFQMALTNRRLAPDIETLFLMPSEEYSYVSSSTVREIARFGGALEAFVPAPALARIRNRITP